VDQVRFGLLGAARIAPAALTRPAKGSTEARVVCMAARDRSRAQAFADRHGVERVVDTYEQVVTDPDVDAVYIPLPNSLHAEWVHAALDAGKHVLCEKPFTSNAAEAEAIATAAASRPNLVVMEAFHYRYHPLAHRMRALVEEGALGKLQHVEASFCFPLPRFNDIRYQFDLAGGALMDAGCYAVHMTRLLGLEEPAVISAKAKVRAPDVDRAVVADLRFPSGHTGTVRCSMWSSSVLRINARAVGDRGELRVFNPLGPHLLHRFSTRIDGRRRRERFPRRATYAYQLDAFCGAVLRGEPTNLTPPGDSVATMRVIDGIYRAAGLPLRAFGSAGS
jgi:predicted dehydrogenase